MSTLSDAVHEFLAQRRIAVAGVSRRGDTAANTIYKKLRATGYEVFPINPNAEQVEGDPCYMDLASIPDGVDAVVIATHPAVAPGIVKECAALGIRRVWMHRAFGEGSVNKEAVALCRELGISVIPGACPMMFCEPVDIAHRCIRWFMRVRGAEPEPVGFDEKQ